MGLAHSPKIVTNGLVLCLDAANIKSYSGSGTTWTDLSTTKNNGTLTSGPTYSSNNGGTFVFDGVDDHIASFPLKLIDNGTKTVSVFFKTSLTSRQSLCEVRNNAASNGWFFVINRTAAGNLTYQNLGAVVTLEVAAGITTNVWYHACVTYDATTTTARLYLNGIQVGDPVTTMAVGNELTTGYNGSIAKPDFGLSVYFQGSIAQVSIYNRALSAAEISQNFNALRGRFGI